MLYKSHYPDLGNFIKFNKTCKSKVIIGKEEFIDVKGNGIIAVKNLVRENEKKSFLIVWKVDEGALWKVDDGALITKNVKESVVGEAIEESQNYQMSTMQRNCRISRRGGDN